MPFCRLQNWGDEVAFLGEGTMVLPLSCRRSARTDHRISSSRNSAMSRHPCTFSPTRSAVMGSPKRSQSTGMRPMWPQSEGRTKPMARPSSSAK